MAVPTTFADLSTTESSNSPAGSDNVFPSLDNYLRIAFAMLASIKANTATNGWVSPYLPNASALVFNESGADLDARFEGDTDANLLFLDAGNDRVGFGTATPAAKVDINGTMNVSGVASFPGGSAAAPSITNTGDTNTGLYFSAADEVSIATGGTQRAVIDASGRLGIGGEPATANVATLARFSGTATNGLLIQDTVAGGVPALFQIEKNGATLNFVDYLGRVGIKTTAFDTGDLLRVYEPSAGYVWTRTGNTLNDMYIGVRSSGEGQLSSSGAYPMLFFTNATERLRITADGRLYGTALHNNAGAVTGTTEQYIASGTYTPTVTAVANVSSTTATAGQWIRVGNVVTVSCFVTVTPSSAAACRVGVSLPIASDFSSYTQGSGSFVDSASNNGTTGGMYGDATNNRMEAYISNPGAGALEYSVHFTYLVA